MKFPIIIKQIERAEKKEVVLTLRVPEEIVYFKGHFSDAPILPGVVQTDWAIHFAHQCLGVSKEKISTIEHLKFTHVIKPGQIVSLSLKIENDRLLFQYFDEEVVFSGGKIKL